MVCPIQNGTHGLPIYDNICMVTVVTVKQTDTFQSRAYLPSVFISNNARTATWWSHSAAVPVWNVPQYKPWFMYCACMKHEPRGFELLCGRSATAPVHACTCLIGFPSLRGALAHWRNTKPLTYFIAYTGINSRQTANWTFILANHIGFADGWTLIPILWRSYIFLLKLFLHLKNWTWMVLYVLQVPRVRKIHFLIDISSVISTYLYWKP